MGAPRYIYQRRGGPLLSWAGGPPSQSRAADTKALGGWFDGLGSLGDYDHPPGNSLGLPMPGAPEFLSGYDAIPSSSPPIHQHGVGDVSCKCGGSCGCSGGMGDTMGMLSGLLQDKRVIAAAALYLGYRWYKKSKRK
jgi:hypothetical protein